MRQQPYGYFPGTLRGMAENETIFMTDWLPDEAPAVRLREFRKWCEETVEEIAHAIWPRYDYTSREWFGKSKGNADQLTIKELRVMQTVFQKPGAMTLDEKPKCKHSAPKIPTHRALYTGEDTTLGDFPPQETLALYHTKLSQEHLDTAAKAISDAFPSKKGPGRKVRGLFWFKGQLQRPRPGNAALQFSENKFVHEIATTGLHSSIMSGHCVQGAIIACSVYEAWLDAELPVKDSHLEALAQFGMDFGDRRVFAGVHFPSDNMASWVMALKLTNRIYTHPKKIEKFLKRAIKKHSLVYKTIHKHYRGDAVFAPALKLLDKHL